MSVGVHQSRNEDRVGSVDDGLGVGNPVVRFERGDGPSVTAITAFSVTVSGRSGETTVVSWTTRSGDTVFERGSTCREKTTPVAVVRSPRGTDLAVIFLAAVL